MMESRTYWGDGHSNVKYDNYNSNDGFGRSGELNFAAASEDECDYPPGGNGYLKKGKVSTQDPMSHRIIEKRRRDRMNNCLADLSRLIPPEYLKKGRGRVEKTEIVEMAIRHIKTLQDRANLYHAAERSDGFLSGYQEASAEAVRFLIEVQGYGPGDGLCIQMAAHLHRNCEHLNKAEPHSKPRAFHQSHSHHPGPSGSSSETTTSSSGSSHYGLRGVIMQAPPPFHPEAYEPERERHYAMECDRDSSSQLPPLAETNGAPESEQLPLNGHHDRDEPTLRTIRKPDHEDFLQSYKFKNSIERRFSRSQDEHAADMSTQSTYPAQAPHSRVNFHKRRRAPKAQQLPTSTSTSNSGSTEEARDTSPQDSSDSHHQSIEHHTHNNEKIDNPPPTQFVPVFALHNIGKYYVPLNVDYSCLVRHLHGYDATDGRAVQATGPLHPVTINVNFQQHCLSHGLVKKEPNEREWGT